MSRSFFSDDKRLLTAAKDRISCIYIEYARLEQDDYSVAILQGTRRIALPVTTIGAVFLGPGTTITHEAVKNLCAAGVSIIWCGAEEWRFYAAGTPTTASAHNILIQTRYHESKTLHMEVVRRMYKLRYPEEHLSRKTISELRGMEGTKVRNLYTTLAAQYGIHWEGRKYMPDDIDAQDTTNRALTIGNQILYGIARSVICLTGFSTALGFIHTGHMLSFVFDVADLYKEKISIPLAFQCAAEAPYNVDKWMRQHVREKVVEQKLMKDIVANLKLLFDEEKDSIPELDLGLWNYATTVAAGKNYSVNT